MNLDQVVSVLSQWSLRSCTESILQSDIAQVFTSEGVEFRREVPLSKCDIIDFAVSRVGIECKIDGSRTSVMSQLSRYAQSDTIDELLLVTSRSSHRSIHGISLNEKPVYVLWIGGI